MKEYKLSEGLLQSIANILEGLPYRQSFSVLNQLSLAIQAQNKPAVEAVPEKKTEV